MAVSFVNNGTNGFGTGNITVALPANWQEGDLLILACESANQVVAAPSGWAEVPSSPIGIGTGGEIGAVRLTVFYKFASSSESSVSVSDSGDHTIGMIFAFRGVDATSPFNAHANGSDSSSTTTKSTPSVTTTIDNCYIFHLVGLDYDGVASGSVTWSNTNLIIDSNNRGYFANSNGRGGGLLRGGGIKEVSGNTDISTTTLSIGLQDVYITLALTPYVEPTNDKTAVLAISQPSTVVTAYTKSEGGINYDLVASVSQSSSVVASLSKQVSSIASVEQVSTVQAENTKAINLASEVSQAITVVADNEKQTYIIADISQLSSVSADNEKHTYLVAEVNQGSTVYSTVSAEVPTYDYNLVASIEQSSDVSASLTKQTSIVGQVAQDESVVSLASKHIEVVASIEQGSTVYSFITKEELEKTISASIEQATIVVASVFKQSDISALIEQPSTIESILMRISASRLTTVIQLSVKLQFKEIILTDNLSSEKTGSIQFDEPIRKVVDLD